MCWYCIWEQFSTVLLTENVNINLQKQPVVQYLRHQNRESLFLQAPQCVNNDHDNFALLHTVKKIINCAFNEVVNVILIA